MAIKELKSCHLTNCSAVIWEISTVGGLPTLAQTTVKQKELAAFSQLCNCTVTSVKQTPTDSYCPPAVQHEFGIVRFCVHSFVFLILISESRSKFNYPFLLKADSHHTADSQDKGANKPCGMYQFPPTIPNRC